MYVSQWCLITLGRAGFQNEDVRTSTLDGQNINLKARGEQPAFLLADDRGAAAGIQPGQAATARKPSHQSEHLLLSFG